MNGSYMSFVLPPQVASKGDVSRLVREVERVDNEQTAAAVREKVGSSGHVDLMLSGELSAFLEQNKLTLDSDRERGELIKELRLLKDKVPVIHMTFAVTADRESLQKLVEWLRASVHPQAVIEVGLQPALVAGVSVRTPNRVHDLSMRAMLKDHHKDLVKELGALRGNS